MNILHFWDCLANMIKNHIFLPLTSGSGHLLRMLHLLYGIINEQGNCLDARDDVQEKLFFTCLPINL